MVRSACGRSVRCCHRPTWPVGVVIKPFRKRVRKCRNRSFLTGRSVATTLKPWCCSSEQALWFLAMWLFIKFDWVLVLDLKVRCSCTATAYQVNTLILKAGKVLSHKKYQELWVPGSLHGTEKFLHPMAVNIPTAARVPGSRAWSVASIVPRTNRRHQVVAS